MGKRGPKQKPTRLKEMAGNPGKRSLETGEFQPPLGAPPAPRRAKKAIGEFYRHYAQMLAELRVLTRADWFAFRLMAEHYVLAMDALAEVRGRKSLLTIDEKGNDRKNPLLQVWRDNSTAFLRYAAEFGLTPSARAGVKPVPEVEQLSLESLLWQGQDVQVGEEE